MSWSAPGSILEGFGTSGADFGGFQHAFFNVLFAPRTRIDRTTCILEKPFKTSTVAIKIKVHVFRDHRKNKTKPVRRDFGERFFRGYVRHVLPERTQTRPGRVQTLPGLILESVWGLLGPLGRLLDISWALLSASWAPLGRSWAPLNWS